MPNFRIDVSANVESQYGAQVYALAVREQPASVADVETFFKYHLIGFNNSLKIGAYVPPAGVAGDYVQVTGFISGEKAVTNITGELSFVTIPHAFVDYHVYVIARNDLALVTVQYMGIRNGYDVENASEIALNQIGTFVDGHPENTLTVTGGNIADYFGVTGDKLLYATLAFADSTSTEAELSEKAHWYLDQLLNGVITFNGEIQTSIIVIPFVAPSLTLTKVIGVLDYVNPANTVLYDASDVNAYRVFVITKKIQVASSPELTGQGDNHYGTTTDSEVFKSTDSHVRVKNARVLASNTLEIDVTGFSSSSVPTKFMVKPYLVGEPEPVPSDAGWQESIITNGQLHTVHQAVISWLGTFDPANEYNVAAYVSTMDPANNSPIQSLLSDSNDATTFEASFTVVTHADEPSSSVTDLVITELSLTGNVAIVHHPLIANATSVKLVASVYDSLPGTFANGTVYNADGSFTLHTTAENYDIRTVSHLFVHGLVTTQDESYTFTKSLANIGESLRPDVGSLYTTFHEITMEGQTVTANIATLYNDLTGSSVALSNVYFGFTEIDVVVTAPATFDSNYKQLTTTGNVDSKSVLNVSESIEFTTDVYGNEMDIRKKYFFHVFTSGVVHSSTEFLPNASGVMTLFANFHPLSGNIEVNSVRTHHVTVTVNSNSKFVFTPALNELYKGDTYVFDHSTQGSHPLEFLGNGSVLSSPEVTDSGNVVTLVVGDYSKIKVNCVSHPNMGDLVNGVSGDGIPVSNKQRTNLQYKDGDILQVVAFTSPRTSAEALSANVDAVVSVTLSSDTGIVPVIKDFALPDGAGLFLDKIIDIADEIHDSTATRNAYVYAWVKTPDPEVFSAVRSANVLNSADRLYPFIGAVDYQINELVIPVGGLSMISSANLSGTSYKLDKYRVMAFADGFTPADYTAFGQDIDIAPDQNTDDIFQNTAAVHIPKKFVNDAGATEDIRPDETIQVVLLAYESSGGETKAYVKTFPGISSGVPGIYGDFAPAFNANKDQIVFNAAAFAEGPGTLVFAASTLPAANVSELTQTRALSFTGKPALSNFAGLVQIHLDYSVKAINKAYVYAWIDNAGVLSAVAEAVIEHTPGTSLNYPKVHSIEIDSPNVTLTGSVYAAQTEIARYLVALVNQELTVDADFILISENNTGSVLEVTGPFAVGNVATFTHSFSHALDNSNSEASLKSGDSYNAYVLVVNSDTTYVLSPPEPFQFVTTGVSSVSNITIANGKITFDVVANGFDSAGGDATFVASAYTREQIGNPSTVNRLGANTFKISSFAEDQTFTGLTIYTVRDTTGNDFNPDTVNEVFLYLQIKRLTPSLEYSPVFKVGFQVNTDTPYPALHNPTILPGTSGDTIGGTISVFDDATGYYLGAFLQSQVADKNDTDMYDFFNGNVTPVTINVADGAVYTKDENIITVFINPFSGTVSQQTTVQPDTAYTVVLIALLAGGGYTVARRDGVVSSSVIPTVSGLALSFDSVKIAANIDQVNLNIPTAGISETVSFYAVATTYPVTSVSAPAPASVPSAVRVTLAQSLNASVEQLSIANAFPSVLDVNGDVVSFKNVQTAYAYAWAQGDTTGNVHPIHVATSSLEPLVGIARVTDLSVDPTDKTITINAASLFSPSGNILEYYTFAVKSEVVTGPSAVQTFVSSGEILENTVFAAARYTALGEKYTFPTPLPEDDQYNIPGYMTVMTHAFIDLNDGTQTETLTVGNTYTVYLVAKTDGNAWFLGASTSLLITSSVTVDPTIATVGEINHLTFDNSVQNQHTVSFNLNSVLSSTIENAEVYAAVFTRDLKNEKHAGSVGEYKNEVYSAEAKLTPILSVPAGTSVSATSLSGFEINKAIDTNGDLVDLYTVNAGYLYVWARTFENAEFAGGRSAIMVVENLGTTPISHRNVLQPLPP